MSNWNCGFKLCDELTRKKPPDIF